MDTFVVTTNPEFVTNVTIYQPKDDGHEKKVLRTRFRVLPNAELNTFDLATYEGTQKYLRRVVVSFENLADETKNPMVCSDATRDDLMDLAYTQNALVTAYTSALLQAKQGN